MNRRVKAIGGFLLALVAAILIANRMPLAPSAPPQETTRGPLGVPTVDAGSGRSTPAPSPATAGSGATRSASEADRSAPSTSRPAFGENVGFRTRALLVEHYEKHGREFPGAGMGAYLRMAQELRDRPADPPVLEIVRADGVITRFDPVSGAFLACNPDGTIRTFFRPNDGERYFRRQAMRTSR